jgi:Ca2+/Na+ antiporter
MDLFSGALLECTFDDLINGMCLEELDAALPLSVARIIEVLFLAVSFCGLAASADVVCNALETGCDRWGIQEDVAGATFLALGGALPETTVNLVVTLQSVWSPTGSAQTPRSQHANKHNKTMLGVGAIIGSGAIAFLLIPIVCYFVSPKRMSLKRRPLARDVFFYFVMMSLLISTIDYGVTPSLCGLLVITYILYLVVVIFGRQVRMTAFRILGIQYVKRQQSIYRERYENEEHPCSADLVEPLVPGTVSRRGSKDLARSKSSSPAVSPVAADGVPLADDAPGKDAEAGQLVKTTTQTVMHTDFEESESASTDPLWKRVLVRFAEIVTKPVDATCVDCRINGPYEAWYPVTIVTGLVWISFFSWMVTCLVSHVVTVLHAGDRGMGFLGFFLVAIGAEIPDTFQAATAARRGYGSMALSSCIGAQVVNVGVGLGLPWIIVTGAGREVPLVWPNGIAWMAYFQRANACIFFCLLIITSWFTYDRKAELTRTIIPILILLYVAAVGGLAMWTFDNEWTRSVLHDIRSANE